MITSNEMRRKLSEHSNSDSHAICLKEDGNVKLSAGFDFLLDDDGISTRIFYTVEMPGESEDFLLLQDAVNKFNHFCDGKSK